MPTTVTAVRQILRGEVYFSPQMSTMQHVPNPISGLLI